MVFVEQLIKGESVLIDSFCNEDYYVPDEFSAGGVQMHRLWCLATFEKKYFIWKKDPSSHT